MRHLQICLLMLDFAKEQKKHSKDHIKSIKKPPSYTEISIGASLQKMYRKFFWPILGMQTSICSAHLYAPGYLCLFVARWWKISNLLEQRISIPKLLVQSVCESGALLHTLNIIYLVPSLNVILDHAYFVAKLRVASSLLD